MSKLSTRREPKCFLRKTTVLSVLLVFFAAAEGPVSATPQGAAPAPTARRTAGITMPWEEQRKLLTSEDLQKVTGLSGLKPGEKNNARDQMLVFSKQEKFADTAADFLVLSVSFVVMEGYWEAQTKSGTVSSARVPVSGVGDGAFEETRDCSLYFHKGKVTVFMMGGPSLLTSKCYVTPEQMRELAKIIASRM